jgi:putative ABC transport system permease protein
MLELVFANLRQRKMRSLVCVIAVGIGIALLIVLTGLCKGMIRESAERMRNTGAHILVQPRSASNLLALKGSSLPVQYGAKLEQLPGVAAACPVLTWTTSIEKVIYVIYGLDLGQYEKIGGTPRIVSGKPWESPNEILIDTRLAHANHYAVGDRITLLNKEFTVSGIFQSGVGARVYLPIDTLEEALHLNDMCSLFFVKASADDQTSIKSAIDGIETQFPALKASGLDRYEDIIVTEVTGLNEFFGVITATALIISFLVILLTMYTTIVERTREFGILRSIGATKRTIMGLVVQESVTLCTLGVAAGYLFALAARLWLSQAHPLLTMEIGGISLLRSAFLGISGGILGALYPGLKAARVDPVEALGYE